MTKKEMEEKLAWAESPAEENSLQNDNPQV